MMRASPMFSTVVNSLKDCLKEEKVLQFPICETSTKALGRLLLHQIKSEPLNTTAYLESLVSLVSAMQDDSSEVRRRALSALKAFAKAYPTAAMDHATIFGSALAECLKDGNAPVRLAAERCALHSFQLTRGTENVQAAQKFITGLDARRISKFPEHSHDSEAMIVKTVKMSCRVVDKLAVPWLIPDFVSSTRMEFCFCSK